MPHSQPILALVGNPNTGKSTLFNRLTGLRQHVGNYPGVTVEMKIGHVTHAGQSYEIVDLPGTYSLAARSPDEMVAVDHLLGHVLGQRRPDAIISIVDATNLDRHLYLTTQLLELGLPVVVAVNMLDLASNQGVTIDLPQLAEKLGTPVVGIQASNGTGVNQLLALIPDLLKRVPPEGPAFPTPFEQEVRTLQTAYPNLEPFLVRRLLLDVNGYTQQQAERRWPEIGMQVKQARERLAAENCAVPGVEARIRYGHIRPIVAATVQRNQVTRLSLSDRIDKILTHRIWGSLVFLSLMFAVFASIFYGADLLMSRIDGMVGALSDAVKEWMAPGAFRSLITDGMLAGVGGVLIFLPQIVILFGFIAILEDCGYMARAAFLMDRIMSRCGLNGKSFIPMLSSVACAVPGIMATRVIENKRDRFATILVAPLMSCSARLPVYALLIGTFLREPWWLPAIVLFGMYSVGLIAAPLVALALKRTVLRGETPLFVMELPSFKWPSLRSVARRMVDAGYAFVRRAGTLILASMVLVWALLYFPNHLPDGSTFEQAITTLETKLEETKAEVERESIQLQIDETYGDWKRQSILGRVGQTLEPIFTPLGWDWKIGMAAIASFPAREVVVGTLGIIYNQGDVDPGSIRIRQAPADDDTMDDDEKAEVAKGSRLKQAIEEDWKSHPLLGPYRVSSALSLMMFFALCCQCVSTLAVIRRETRSWAWPIFTFVYMTVLAYIAALVVFQVGRLITNALGG